MRLTLDRSFMSKVHNAWGDAEAVARICYRALLDNADPEEAEDRENLALRVGILIGRFAGETGQSRTAEDFLRRFDEDFGNG